MNGTNVFFDTCAVIKLFNQQYDLSSLGINVDGAISSPTQFFTSVIVRIELLSKRNITLRELQDTNTFLDRVTVVPLNEKVEKKAIELRRATKLKLPDSIIVATSIISDSILLTDDHHLLNLSWPGLRTQNIF